MTFTANKRMVEQFHIHDIPSGHRLERQGSAPDPPGLTAGTFPHHSHP